MVNPSPLQLRIRMAASWSITVMVALVGASLSAAACTGRVAGPEQSQLIPVPASRDSAYVRARRALQGESFTMDVVDSTGGRLVGTRWPSSSAQQGSQAACHVAVEL